jgi:SAM-dependent methyltransferase
MQNAHSMKPADLSRLPTYAPWDELRSLFVSTVEREFGQYMTATQPNYVSQLQFATGRFDEGLALLRHFATANIAGTRELDVLDVGAGNGGVAFAFANLRSIHVLTLDIVPNLNLLAVKRDLPVPVIPIVGDGAALPFRDGQFDVVLLLDTLEHVDRPALLAQNIMSALRPGGVCVITTPARMRHLFGRDPHFGIPGLAAFPNFIQRFVTNHIFRRRVHVPSGRDVPAYDVTHLYWNVAEVSDLFPSPKRVEVLYNREHLPPGKLFQWVVLRNPSLAVKQIRYDLREYFFDRILIWKSGS